MCIREWISRHAKALAVTGALLLHGGTAEAQWFNFTLPTTVSTDKGSLVGKTMLDGTRQFLGVPYAAPPTGSRRWKAPAPESAYFLRDASRFAKHCPQLASPFGDASTTEDCLYLNVFAPSTWNTLFQPAPVMVWLHSGSYQTGESDDFDPTELVKKGVVVVTLNYRLGALGFMAHPALSAESGVNASGNYGLMDQQAALRWVQRNIKAFGGDPKSVTLFGQSAGGSSVYAHIASPASAGLFHRAIAQSGSYEGYSPSQTQAAAEADGQAFATAVGCPQQDLACLRAVPVSTLLAQQNPKFITYRPTEHAVLLPEGVWHALAFGNFNKVPVLHGATHEEFALEVALRELEGYPTNANTYESNISAIFGYDPGSAHTVATFWSSDDYENDAALALTGYGTAAIYSCGLRAFAHHLSAVAPVFTYEFDDPTAPQEVLPPVSFPMRSYRGSEVQYLLDSFDGSASLNDGQKQLAALMKTYWVNFAKTGDPNGGNAPVWPQYHDTPGFPTEPNIYMKLSQAPRSFNDYEFTFDHHCGYFRGGY